MPGLVDVMDRTFAILAGAPAIAERVEARWREIVRAHDREIGDALERGEVATALVYARMIAGFAPTLRATAQEGGSPPPPHEALRDRGGADGMVRAIDRWARAMKLEHPINRQKAAQDLAAVRARRPYPDEQWIAIVGGVGAAWVAARPLFVVVEEQVDRINRERRGPGGLPNMGRLIRF